mmetsp:Transcript_28042/g.24748  ORF Transcript_28042/g.24748 Transcript_28042/m.24748 type:complete len:129 (+) Transcript_28042:357-743(+)
MFKDHPSKPRFVAIPHLREIMAGSADVPSDIRLIKKEFPEVDFSLIEELEMPELWAFYNLKNEHYRREIFSLVKENHNLKESSTQNLSKSVLNMLKEIHPQRIETVEDLSLRAIEAQTLIKQRVTKDL